MSSRLLLLCCMMLQLCGASRVVLQNNGYKNVVVAIDESVSYTTSAQLIPAIKTAFTEASHYIYTATERRAYFRDVRIVVPSSWPPSDEYATAVWETFETAEVRIGNLDQVDQAFTRRSIGLCGRQADYIFSTPGRFTRVDQQVDSRHALIVTSHHASLARGLCTLHILQTTVICRVYFEVNILVLFRATLLVACWCINGRSIDGVSTMNTQLHCGNSTLTCRTANLRRPDARQTSKATLYTLNTEETVTQLQQAMNVDSDQQVEEIAHRHLSCSTNK